MLSPACAPTKSCRISGTLDAVRSRACAGAAKTSSVLFFMPPICRNLPIRRKRPRRRQNQLMRSSGYWFSRWLQNNSCSCYVPLIAFGVANRRGYSMPTKPFDRQSAAVLLLGWVVALITTLT